MAASSDSLPDLTFGDADEIPGAVVADYHTTEPEYGIGAPDDALQPPVEGAQPPEREVQTRMAAPCG